MTDNEKNHPSAWVWSQYRGELPADDTAPNRVVAAAAAAETEERKREHPPLVPKESGVATGPLLAALLLLAAGMTWWFSGAQPKLDETPQETAQTEPEAAASPESETPAPSAAEVEPSAEKAPEATPTALTTAEKIAAAKEKLAALPSAGALDAASCQTALNASVTVEKIQFRSGRAAIERASIVLLDRLAGLLKRCPDAKAEIGGHTDNVGAEAANQTLSQRRADSVAAYLKKAGVPGARLSAVGHGPSNPIASNETEEGRAENRRIEFTLK